MERLWHHFDGANQAAMAHSQATWQYPIHLVSRLHEKLDEEPGRSTVDIVVHKFQHLWKAEDSDKFVMVDNPNIILFTPVLDSSTYYRGLGTNRYSFRVEYHSRSPSPLGTPTIPLVSPIPRSLLYHVTSPSPPLLHRIRSPSPLVIVNGADQELINCLPHYTHPRLLFVKNRSDGRLCIVMTICDANNNKGKAKYIRFILDDVSPRALLTMGRGHPVFVIQLRARPRDRTQSPFNPFHQRIFKYGQPYQHLVDCALCSLGDPFIEGEILQFCHLTQELQEARQEVVNARMEVCHAQQVKMLAISALAATRQAMDASAAHFEQVGAYGTIHPHLFCKAPWGLRTRM